MVVGRRALPLAYRLRFGAVAGRRLFPEPEFVRGRLAAAFHVAVGRPWRSPLARLVAWRVAEAVQGKARGPKHIVRGDLGFALWSLCRVCGFVRPRVALRRETQRTEVHRTSTIHFNMRYRLRIQVTTHAAFDGVDLRRGLGSVARFIANLASAGNIGTAVSHRP